MSQILLTPQQTELLLRTWELSESAIAVLIHEPELVVHLEEMRSRPPFPPGYVPDVIEELFDDLPYRRWELGRSRPIYERQCSPDYEPPFVEYSFDNETALFHVQGEIIVNRVAAITAWSEASVDYANRLDWLTPQEI